MLYRVDRMLLAVRDRARAGETFVRLLGATVLREERSDWLNAQALVLAVGESELELWEPQGNGPVAEQLAEHGEGLLFAGYATQQFEALAARLRTRLALLAPGHVNGAPEGFVREGDRVYLKPPATPGLPMAISPWRERERVGPVSFFYEATNALNTDWQTASAHYADLFALDASQFSAIDSERFGYRGTLTLFDAKARLDRIELSQTFADKPGAMRRFVERRGGDAFYMCFIETHDFVGLRDRLLREGASLTPQGGNISRERDTMWVHPKNLHGMLLGVSRTDYAWSWSGQPARVPAHAN